MDEANLTQSLLSQLGATQDFPFGPDVAVFRVAKKMFALLGIHRGMLMLNLKCPPEQGAALREMFPAITEGYHMDKRHWISLYFDSSNPIPEGEVERLIEQSYQLVLKSLPKKTQATFKADTFISE